MRVGLIEGAAPGEGGIGARSRSVSPGLFRVLSLEDLRDRRDLAPVVLHPINVASALLRERVLDLGRLDSVLWLQFEFG